MTDLKAEQDRTRRFVRRTSPASLLSDTKWRKLLAALQEPAFDLETVWMKFLDVEGEKAINLKSVGLYGPRAFIDTFEFGPFDLNAIEWLRIPATHARPVVRRLEEIGQFVIEDTEDGVRIIGHRL